MMHLVIHMFNTSMIPYISLDQYLNPNLCMRFFAVQYIYLKGKDVFSTLCSKPVYLNLCMCLSCFWKVFMFHG